MDRSIHSQDFITVIPWWRNLFWCPQRCRKSDYVGSGRKSGTRNIKVPWSFLAENRVTRIRASRTTNTSWITKYRSRRENNSKEWIRRNGMYQSEFTGYISEYLQYHLNESNFLISKHSSHSNRKRNPTARHIMSWLLRLVLLLV